MPKIPLSYRVVEIPDHERTADLLQCEAGTGHRPDIAEAALAIVLQEQIPLFV